jgi:hypothetical protein
MVLGVLRHVGTDSILRDDVPVVVDGGASNQDDFAMAFQSEVHRRDSGILF